MSTGARHSGAVTSRTLWVAGGGGGVRVRFGGRSVCDSPAWSGTHLALAQRRVLLRLFRLGRLDICVQARGAALVEEMEGNNRAVRRRQSEVSSCCHARLVCAGCAATNRRVEPFGKVGEALAAAAPALDAAYIRSRGSERGGVSHLKGQGRRRFEVGSRRPWLWPAAAAHTLRPSWKMGCPGWKWHAPAADTRRGASGQG